MVIQKAVTVALILGLISTLFSMNTASGSVFLPSDSPPSIQSDAVKPSFFFVPVLPYENVTVSFDASASKSDNGFIVSYRWNFGDGTPEVVETDPIAYHNFTSNGDYQVTLTATDNMGQSSLVSQLIAELPYPMGPWIDVYTSRGGVGLSQPDGEYAPGARVDLYALVTYNTDPVAFKMVAFEVRDPTGATLLIRSAETNLDGVAEMNFVIPTAVPPEHVIGTWVAFAVSSVSEQTISDTVYFRVRGLMIDVYTQQPDPYSGKGPHQPSDAFGPQEEVILYAYVTFDLEPVAFKMVAFEVRDPLGGTFYRENNTDENGIATVRFRIPWQGMEAEQLFGTWHIRAWVEVIGDVAEDTLTFLFGWIIETREFKTVDAAGQSKTNFMRGEHIFFNITVFNISYFSKIASFTIVAYDLTGVPIGHMILRGWLVPSGSFKIFIVDLLIPQWAMLGSGLVFTNAYTELPQNNGVPYCPEKSVPFMINP